MLLLKAGLLVKLIRWAIIGLIVGVILIFLGGFILLNVTVTARPVFATCGGATDSTGASFIPDNIPNQAVPPTTVPGTPETTAPATGTESSTPFNPLSLPEGVSLPGGLLNGRQLERAMIVMAMAKEVFADRDAQVQADAALIGLMTVAQESHFKNYRSPAVPASQEEKYMGAPYYSDAVGADHDSVGIFQQQVSPPEARDERGDGGWGTVAELMDPAESSRKFYNALKKKDWENISFNDAAQNVQHSAFPNAYAKHEEPSRAAMQWVPPGQTKPLWDGVQAAQRNCSGIGGTSGNGEWSSPLPPGSFRLGQTIGAPREGHEHQGLDLMARKRTPILAIADGVVNFARCSPVGTNYCDYDQSMKSCGNMVEVQHAPDFVSWYCHGDWVQPRFAVKAGDHVKAGQTIMYVGNTGSSSGPHLHFEVHPPGQPSNRRYVEPIAFMKSKGIDLASLQEQ